MCLQSTNFFPFICIDETAQLHQNTSKRFSTQRMKKLKFVKHFFVFVDLLAKFSFLIRIIRTEQMTNTVNTRVQSSIDQTENLGNESFRFDFSFEQKRIFLLLPILLNEFESKIDVVRIVSLINENNRNQQNSLLIFLPAENAEDLIGGWDE